MDFLNISSSRSSESSEDCLNVETSNNLIDVPFEEKINLFKILFSFIFSPKNVNLVELAGRL